jgi:type IV pilus assembly protein PilE
MKAAKKEAVSMAGNDRNHRHHGFTLIEIMIAMAIIAIIAAVALPAYTESRLRAGRADGKTALMQVASDQERFYSNNYAYTSFAVPLATPSLATLTSRDGKYVVAVAACAGLTIDTCFLATATPQGDQTEDICGNLTISSTGDRAASGGTVANCWQR